jgi:hypothetical protein
LSVGYKTVQSRRDAASKQRQLLKIDLWEISVVTFPMLPEARIAEVKRAGALMPTTRTLEKLLTQDAGLTRAQARLLIKSGYGALAPKLAAGGTAAMIARLQSASQMMRP